FRPNNLHLHVMYNFFAYSTARPPALPTFPTRRSSDLGDPYRLGVLPRVRQPVAHGDHERARHRPAPGFPLSRRERGSGGEDVGRDRKSTRLNSSHDQISYAVFCLKKKKKRDILADADE